MRICIQLHDRHEIKTHANNDYNRYWKSFSLDHISHNAFLRTRRKGKWYILRVHTISNFFHGDSGSK
jgi:hypothetical protein